MFIEHLFKEMHTIRWLEVERDQTSYMNNGQHLIYSNNGLITQINCLIKRIIIQVYFYCCAYLAFVWNSEYSPWKSIISTYTFVHAILFPFHRFLHVIFFFLSMTLTLHDVWSKQKHACKKFTFGRYFLRTSLSR